jgi:probable HAF family extracellular repeat protein
MKKQLILCWCIAILLLTSVSAKADPFFMGLGRLPGLMYSEARGVSGDGSVVVGSGDSGQTKRAFRWTLDGGMVQLADLPGGSLESEARGVSGDGSVVVGGSGSASGREATRWTQDGQAAGLGDLPGGSFYSFGLDASYDGSVVVGFSSSYLDREAFRWTENGGMLGLGYLSGHSYASYAYGVSDDGLVVVGHGISPATATQAFLWTQDSGMAGLGYLPGGNSSTALDVSGAPLSTGPRHFSGHRIRGCLGSVVFQEARIPAGPMGSPGVALWLWVPATVLHSFGTASMGCNHSRTCSLMILPWDRLWPGGNCLWLPRSRTMVQRL